MAERQAGREAGRQEDHMASFASSTPDRQAKRGASRDEYSSSLSLLLLLRFSFFWSYSSSLSKEAEQVKEGGKRIKRHTDTNRGTREN